MLPSMAAALERKIGEGQSMHVTYLDVFRVRAADLNHDNELSFEELLAVMYPLANNKELGVMLKWATRGKAVSAADTAFYPTAEELEELKAMFCLYDKDRNATLDLKELRAAASSCGFNAEEVENLFDAADIDKDKKISFDEFVQMMSMCYM
ncbi:hypothetical protein QJQ45_014552 [Haematococcus lacustris]|nr:hypothetical protein QJQ45_014552 [Haematococcus lacustris]